MDFEKTVDQDEAMLEEFSVSELDDRFEFVTWCDNQCNCKKQA
jgi:hypothetical protein